MTKSHLLTVISEAWGWTGIQPQSVVGENDFGNLIIRDLEANYWRLSPEELYCKVVAVNREALDQLSMDSEFLEDWYMANLVTAAREKLGELLEGRKYYLVIPPILGGEYSAANIQTLSLRELIGASGSLAQQIQDLPDGSKVRLVVN